jgi:hypothetical protein
VIGSKPIRRRPRSDIRAARLSALATDSASARHMIVCVRFQL